MEELNKTQPWKAEDVKLYLEGKTRLTIENMDVMAIGFENWILLMKTIKEMKISFYLNEIELDPDMSMLLLKEMKISYEEYRKNVRRKCQMGIQRALMAKENGLGNYGRPKTKLPADFEQRIKECRDRGISLETYRKQTNIARSTFYKYAKQILD